MWVLSHEPWDRAWLGKGLVPTPAIPVAATSVAAITPMITVIPVVSVIPVIPMIPVTPMTTVIAMATPKTTKFKNLRDPHAILSFIFSEAFNRPGVSKARMWRPARI
jgi:hypothetical protein